MNSQSPEKSGIPGRESNNSLIGNEDWTQYYLDRQFEQIERIACTPAPVDDFLKAKAGKMFELGCGGSPMLARCARLGWEVGGIDYNAEGLGRIRDYLAQKGYGTANLACGDIFSYDCSEFENTYDQLYSSGFLEHFSDPAAILDKWKRVLKPGGVVLTDIPNLFSVNASLLKKFDPGLWAQHYRYSPQDLDRCHVAAGLAIARKARYSGQYDIHMLIPWAAIQQRMNNRLFFGMAKRVGYYGAKYFLSRLPKSNMRLVNSSVVGVYTRP